MITYRKIPRLRIDRREAPEPPFWAASIISPYSQPGSAPLSIDYSTLTAAGTSNAEVTIVENIRDQIQREEIRSPLTAPVWIDATGFAESVFRRGEEALRFCLEEQLAAVQLISADGVIPRIEPSPQITLVIAAWPLDPRTFSSISALFDDARESGLTWGVFIPVVFPASTSLERLMEIADLAAAADARFLGSATIELEPTAKATIAREAFGAEDQEGYDTLFHSDLETIGIATERHVAALAAERGMLDFVPPPAAGLSNWAAASELSRVGDRIVRMRMDMELGWTLLRSSRLVAQLPKSLQTIASAATLSIIEDLDEVAADILDAWMESERSPFIESIDERWRLRRDVRPD